MLEKQRKEPGDAVVSTVLFDNETEVIHDRVSIADVPNLTDKEYYVRGCTALLDAIGGAIHHIGNVHKYARKEDVPEKTLFIITTDGMENASRRYTYEKVRTMIERQKERYRWEFIFLGANIDAAAEAKRFGILNCHPDGTIYEFEEKPAQPKSTLASMGIYIFTWSKLRQYLIDDENDPNSSNDFGKNIIPAMLGNGENLQTYRFDGYWKDVGTIESLWEANMDLLSPDSGLKLDDPDWKIYGRTSAAPPRRSCAATCAPCSRSTP